MKKLKVAIIFGGRSGEHEVSLVSAASILKALNPKKYETIQIGITSDGEWYTGKNCLQAFKKGNFKNLEKLLLFLNSPTGNFITENKILKKIDIIFPVLHGPFGEDGTIQGLFEIINIPYVGCSVLASSTAMDKLQCKAIWLSAGLPVVPYIGFTRNAWASEKNAISRDIKKNIGIPCFVKPANMGSSVGISKVKNEKDLDKAIKTAAKFDRRILVEKAVNAREIECSIFGNENPIASPVGEVIVGGEFYDFNDKYINGVSTTKIPADIDKKIADKIREMCIKAYKLLDCSGLSRIDCFVDRDTGAIYLNELNTMPGFTSISMYPKMMEAHGISYENLIDKLIQLGMERYNEKQQNQIRFDSGSDWFKK